MDTTKVATDPCSSGSPRRKRPRLPAQSPSLERTPARNLENAAAARSLIAFDVDKTVLHQDDKREIERFREAVAKILVDLARMGFNLAAVTGNDIRQLCTRFLKGLLEELCEQRCLECLSRFHFFCNGASVYFHLNPERSGCEAFAALLAKAPDLSNDALLSEARKCLLDERGDILPVFISVRYAQQCCITADHSDMILRICNEEAQSWWKSVAPDGVMSETVQGEFYIATGVPEFDVNLRRQATQDTVNKEASVYVPPSRTHPLASTRTCVAADGKSFVTSCNVKPLLSFRHARNKLLPHREDPRIQMVERLRKRLAEADLCRYLVNPGGRGSIDITHHLVNKRSALNFLLRHLGCEGVGALGEPHGVNCVFFGDEVVFNGNDLAVAEIPGILVFAVNELLERVPFHTNIEIPSRETQETGPEATKAVLEDLLEFVRREEQTGHKVGTGRSIVARWKEERLRHRLKNKCAQLAGELHPEPGQKITYQRLEAAAAAVTAILREGEGLERFAVNLIGSVNEIGAVTNQVREHQFESNLFARGFCGRYLASPLTHKQSSCSSRT